MAAKTNYWKLGLFVFLGLIVAFAALVVLGASEFDRDETVYVTYFDESVQGMDVGSPVKFRGVTIGRVNRVGIAPDGRHVRVDSAVDATKLTNLGLTVDELGTPKDLRFQLASAGLTGLKFIQADFFPSETHPRPSLPFPTPPNYIPAAPSTLKSIEDSVVRSVSHLPDASEQTVRMLRNINQILEDFYEQRIPLRMANSLDKMDATFDNANATMTEAQKTIALARKKIDRFESEKVSASAREVLERLAESLQRVNRVLARVEADGGLIDNAEATSRILRSEAENLEGTMEVVNSTMRSVKGTANAFSDMARNATELSGDFDATLVVIKEAANAIRRVADALERDSDMLVKGRTRGQR